MREKALSDIAQKALDLQPNGAPRPDIAGGSGLAGASAGSDLAGAELGAGWLDEAKGRGLTLALVSGGYVGDTDALWDHYEANRSAINGYFAHVDNGALLESALLSVPAQRGAYFALGCAAGALGIYLLNYANQE